MLINNQLSAGLPPNGSFRLSLRYPALHSFVVDWLALNRLSSFKSFRSELFCRTNVELLICLRFFMFCDLAVAAPNPERSVPNYTEISPKLWSTLPVSVDSCRRLTIRGRKLPCVLIRLRGEFLASK